MRTSKLLEKMARMALIVEEPELCVKYLSELKLRGGKTGITTYKKVVKLLANKDKSMAEKVLEEHKEQFTEEELQGMKEFIQNKQ